MGLFDLVSIFANEEEEAARMQRRINKMRLRNFRKKRLKERVDELEDDLDMMNLLNMVLISLLSDNNVLTKKDFTERLRKLDVLDDIEDNKVTPEAVRKALKGIWPK